MKKTLLLSAIIFGSFSLNAAELPKPIVTVLPQPFDWFDAFAVTWAQDPNQPYSLELLDVSGITVTKNLIEDVMISDVQLVEFQEGENTQNYPNSRLVITLSMLETSLNAYYTLTVPAGTVNIKINDAENIPNDKVEYCFTLYSEKDEPKLPDPIIQPEPGTVKELSTVKISWEGNLGSLDLLNLNNVENAITLTNESGDISYPEVKFEWSSRLAATEGSAGDIIVLTLVKDGEIMEPGNYTITIPQDYLQITDIETGTLYNEEIKFVYSVEGDSGKIVSLKSSQKENPVIYNLKGEKLKCNDLNLLPKGIYIINGEKIIK